MVITGESFSLAKETHQGNLAAITAALHALFGDRCLHQNALRAVALRTAVDPALCWKCFGVEAILM